MKLAKKKAKLESDIDSINQTLRELDEELKLTANDKDLKRQIESTERDVEEISEFINNMNKHLIVF